jgi:hypothetical protein
VTLERSTLQRPMPAPYRWLQQSPHRWRSDGLKARCCPRGRPPAEHQSFTAGVLLESASAIIRRSPGTASIRISCRLPSSSVAKMLTPAVLLCGRANESTSPSPTRSSINPRMGIAFGRVLYGTNCITTADMEDIGLGSDKLRRILRNQINM